MYFEKPFEYIQDFDIKKIKKEIELIDAEWNLNKTRQTRSYNEHGQTKSLFITNFPLSWDGNGYPLSYTSYNVNLVNLTKDIINVLENKFNGKVGRCLYIILPKGKSVGQHVDHGYYLSNVHRLHIPIITNNNVLFHLGTETTNLKEGKCYEINNKILHSVENLGDCDRIHLLVDIIPTELIK